MLILSLSYGIGGPIVTVAMLCLALNLILTGAFILVVKQLVGAKTATVTTIPRSQVSQPSIV